MDWMDVEISLDLISAARRHLRFLDNADNIEKLLTNSELLELSIKRYEQLWLPLVHEYRSEQIVPPIDIAWVWYCHMLNPLSYRRDCRVLLHQTLQHKYVRSRDLIGSTNTAIEVWYEKYPKDGFNIIRNGEFIAPSRTVGTLTDSPSKLSANLSETAKSLMHFCYQVALPHFRDKLFLENALKRYKQFLCLKRVSGSDFLAPSIDILLMWFTHMCHPIEYAVDTTKTCGRVLENNIKIQIGYISEKFRSASLETSKIWNNIVNEQLILPGTKLRARDTRKEINEMTPKALKSCCVVAYKLTLSNVELVGFPGKLRRKIKMRLQLLQSHTNADDIVLLKGSKRQKHWNFKTTVSYTTGVHSGVRIILTENASHIVCMTSENTIASGSIKLDHFLERMEENQTNMSLDIQMNAKQNTEFTSNNKLFSHLDVKVENAQPLMCNLTLMKTNKGFTEEVVGTEDLLKIFCRSTLADNRRSHRLLSKTSKFRNHDGREHFTCHVVHISEQLLSGVQVYFCQELMATSYVIGSSQLPLPSQVSRGDLSMAFEPENGDRAMLIRNGKGDWGLCIGRWIADTEDGYLRIKFMQLSKIKLKLLEVHSVDVRFQHFYANLQTGIINIDPTDNTVCENLALVFSIAILHALCSPEQPQRGIKSTLSVNSASNIDADVVNVTKETKIAESACALLLAAGLQTSTPNNEYIQKKYGSLSIDLTFDAQDIYLDEIQFDRSMFEQDCKLTKFDVLEETPRKLKSKMKSKSKLGQLEGSQSDTSADAKENNPKTKMPKETKRKRLRKRKSTKLEDEMCPSDDSLDLDVKEQVQFLQKTGEEATAAVETAATEKLLKKKKSGKLEEELTPSEDSLDEAEKEWKEFKGEDDKDSNIIEEQNLAVDEGETINFSRKSSAIKEEIAKEILPQQQSDNKADKDQNQSDDSNSKGINNVHTSAQNNSKDNMKGVVQTDAAGCQRMDMKESKKEKLKRISEANAKLVSDDSLDSLTPVESDTSNLNRRKRKRQQSTDKRNENHIQMVKETTKDSSKNMTVTFY